MGSVVTSDTRLFRRKLFWVLPFLPLCKFVDSMNRFPPFGFRKSNLSRTGCRAYLWFRFVWISKFCLYPNPQRSDFRVVQRFRAFSISRHFMGDLVLALVSCFIFWGFTLWMRHCLRVRWWSSKFLPKR